MKDPEPPILGSADLYRRLQAALLKARLLACRQQACLAEVPVASLNRRHPCGLEVTNEKLLNGEVRCVVK
jgi:hypothetical protein